MNRGIKIFMVMFSVFMIALLLNITDQLNTPLSGDWTSITTNFISAIPYFFFIFLGLYQATKGGHIMSTTLSCAMTGFAFAGLFGYWNTNGIIVDEYITASLTITDLQTVVIVIWSAIGLIIGVARS